MLGEGLDGDTRQLPARRYFSAALEVKCIRRLNCGLLFGGSSESQLPAQRVLYCGSGVCIMHVHAHTVPLLSRG